MQRPDGFLDEGKDYTVTVTKILSKGIIVKIKDTEDTDFIHISKISTEFVSNINEYVKVGDILSARTIKRGDKFSEPELSLQHLHLKSLYTPEQSVCDTELVTKVSSERNLEDMIAAANLSLKDKMQTIHTRTERKRKNPKRKSKF
ncbi:MAG: S1 RNA-binding domain-containing protein [Clostridiales bacterium]|nr:S1 RNA-binding domain-containing protein [Clostridiales bacterium]